jgi:dTDP-4-amino-4,6-dideoxygalactose transaminase
MFSLQAIKHMTTVDGGMLVCRNPDDLPRGRRIRWFGIDRQMPRTEVDVTEVGYKYHMNNVTATIGLVQLQHIAGVLGRHIENGRYFDVALAGIPGLELCRWETCAEPSYWFYTVLAERRDDLARYLTKNGIGNSMAHKRNDWHSVFARSRCPLPGVDRFYARMLHIPCGWWVTSEQREKIAAVFRRGW